MLSRNRDFHVSRPKAVEELAIASPTRVFNGTSLNSPKQLYGRPRLDVTQQVLALSISVAVAFGRWTTRRRHSPALLPRILPRPRPRPRPLHHPHPA